MRNGGTVALPCRLLRRSGESTNFPQWRSGQSSGQSASDYGENLASKIKASRDGSFCYYIFANIEQLISYVLIGYFFPSCAMMYWVGTGSIFPLFLLCGGFCCSGVLMASSVILQKPCILVSCSLSHSDCRPTVDVDGGLCISHNGCHPRYFIASCG